MPGPGRSPVTSISSSAAPAPRGGSRCRGAMGGKRASNAAASAADREMRQCDMNPLRVGTMGGHNLQHANARLSYPICAAKAVKSHA